MKYIRESIDKKDQGCIFCAKPRETADRTNLILYRGETVFVIMNAYPYNNGHLMVIPYCHTNTMDDIDATCAAELWSTLSMCRSALTKAMKPDGFNIGINLGRTAGAGIDQHLHAHIVPRWNGDVNFMSVTGETKVISQSLEDAYDMLVYLFKNENTEHPK
jgi:ATP adenylyltransferase